MSVYLEMKIDELEDEITALKAVNQKLQLEKNELKEQLLLQRVIQQRELLDCPKCNKQHYISVPLVDKNTCQICKHEWQSYSG